MNPNFNHLPKLQQQFVELRRVHMLTLNQVYIIKRSDRGMFETMVRFVKVTAKGYNFINILTGKAILPRHIYPRYKDKRYFEEDETKPFWVYKRWVFTEVVDDAFEQSRDNMRTYGKSKIEKSA